MVIDNEMFEYCVGGCSQITSAVAYVPSSSVRLRIDKGRLVERVAFWTVMLAMVIAGVYALAMIVGRGGSLEHDIAQYKLTFAQGLVGTLAMLLPLLLAKFGISTGSYLRIGFYALIFCGIFLGEFCEFYFRISFWDDILHALAPTLIFAFGLCLIDNYCDRRAVEVGLGPKTLIAVLFAICIGLAWEIYEFAMDGILGLNMQKTMLESGEPLVGRLALVDTMSDLIEGVIGAVTSAIVYYKVCTRHSSAQAGVMDTVDILDNASTVSAVDTSYIASTVDRVATVSVASTIDVVDAIDNLNIVV